MGLSCEKRPRIQYARHMLYKIQISVPTCGRKGRSQFLAFIVQGWYIENIHNKPGALNVTLLQTKHVYHSCSEADLSYHGQTLFQCIRRLFLLYFAQFCFKVQILFGASKRCMLVYFSHIVCVCIQYQFVSYYIHISIY